MARLYGSSRSKVEYETVSCFFLKRFLLGASEPRNGSNVGPYTSKSSSLEVAGVDMLERGDRESG